MSWQLASFAVLALVLVGGFAWYERSRPPAQIVALVACMAALAVAGRVAFPVIPNVVATTDVVIFTGYAIGAAPGFAVGALAGLVSNFWLGQGPWTPWQMAGWGLCGLAGAWLAAITGRRLGRFGLAAVCGLAGLAYGALLDFSLMVTYGGEQSLDRFLAFSSRGVPFNIAHSLGNITIALIAGPALVRMLIRFRERFEFRWDPGPRIPAAAAGVTALALLVLLVSSAGAAQQSSTVSWLRGAQNADGGFGVAAGMESSAEMTGWAALGAEAAGVNPLDLRKGKKTPIDYLRSNARSIKKAGDLERTILVLAGAGLSPVKFGGKNLVAALRGQRSRDGSWGGQVNATAFGVLALDAAGSRGGLRRSAGWLVGVQNEDGGWGFAVHTGSDADSTGAVLQALAVTGRRDAAARGAAFLRGTQRSGGGFPLSGGAVNSQSTAWAIQGLLAAGKGGKAVKRGLSYLAARRAADAHYRYSAASDQTPVWVTGQALLAVERRPFPLAAVPQASKTSAAAKAPAAPAPAPAPVKPDRKQKPPPENEADGKEGPSASGAIPPGEVPLSEAPVTTPPDRSDDEGDGGVDVLPLAAAFFALALLGWVGYLIKKRLF